MDARASTISGLLEEAGTWKPGGRDEYNTQIAKRRDYVQGRQYRHARDVLKDHFPKTAEAMIPHVVQLFKHSVDNVATLYRYAPHRVLARGEVVDQAATDAMLGLYRSALVDVEMHAAERAAAAGRVAFLRSGWDSFEGRVVLTRFWSDNVDVVCDPQHPGRLDRARVLIARLLTSNGLSGSGDTVSRYEVWQRVGEGWARYEVTTDGATWKPAELEAAEVHRFLPWVAVHHADPGGLLFPELPTDDIAAADSATAGYSNRDHLIAMQAHSQRWVTGVEAEDKAGEWRTGPDELWVLNAGAFGELSGNPQIAAVDEALQKSIERQLLLDGVSPAQATVDPKYLDPGALRQLNNTRDEARQDRVPFAQLFEERYLWPLLRAVAENHGGQRFPDGIEMRCTFGKMASKIDDSADWDLSFKLIEANASTLPAELVKHGHAQTEAEAMEQLRRNSKINAEVSALSGAAADLSGDKLADVVDPEAAKAV